jgi:hypothetical protein
MPDDDSLAITTSHGPPGCGAPFGAGQLPAENRRNGSSLSRDLDMCLKFATSASATVAASPSGCVESRGVLGNGVPRRRPTAGLAASIQARERASR